jgi:anthranilate phosphoribosyltransferase
LPAKICPSITKAFDVIMRGEGTPVQVAALLMALRVKGETAAEVGEWLDSIKFAKAK